MFPMLSFDVVVRHQLWEVLQGWLVAMEPCNHMTSAWPGLSLLYICSVAKLEGTIFLAFCIFRGVVPHCFYLFPAAGIWRSGADHISCSRREGCHPQNLLCLAEIACHSGSNNGRYLYGNRSKGRLQYRATEWCNVSGVFIVIRDAAPQFCGKLVRGSRASKRLSIYQYYGAIASEFRHLMPRHGSAATSECRCGAPDSEVSSGRSISPEGI